MIHIHVRFFAGHRDIVGKDSLQLSLEPGITVGELWERLTQEFPPLARYTGSLLYAVDQQFSDPDTVLHDGCEVAFIPPVSGGSEGGSHRAAVPPPVTDAWCAITTEPLDAAALTRAVQTPEDGAVVTFAGVVRNNFAGHPTAYLTYEAYTEMAVPVLSQIVQEARTRWHIGHAAVHHRVGKLDIGETAVLVVVAAPHRQAGFAAVAYIMDRIKQIAPIWKCEHWADGSSTWQG